MSVERLEQKQLEVIQEAIGKHYVSPQVVLRACEFAEEQGQYIIHYDFAKDHFFLSDGEPYTTEAVLNHFGIKNIFS